MRALRIVARVILGALLVVGWMSLVLAVLLFSAEKTGVITRLVRDAAATRLGSLGHDLKLDEVRLRWFEPAIEVDGITFGRGGEWLKLQSARVELGVLGPRGLRVDRIEARGGRLRLSRVLIEGLKSYEERVQGRSALSGRAGIVPTVRIEDLSVEVESARLGLLPLGHIDLLLRPDERNKPEMWGLVVPTLAASAADPGEIYVHGKVREADVFEVRATATHLPLGTDFLPAGSDLDFVRPYEPSGSFELDASGLIGLDGSVAPRARAHADPRRLVPRLRRRTAHQRREARSLRDVAAVFDRTVAGSGRVAQRGAVQRPARSSALRIDGGVRPGCRTGDARESVDPRDGSGPRSHAAGSVRQSTGAPAPVGSVRTARHRRSVGCGAFAFRPRCSSGS
jgi:hypothetical protein